MAEPTLGPRTEAALADLSSDPFAQAAIWRLYVNEPAVLHPTAMNRIRRAQTADAKNPKESPL